MGMQPKLQDRSSKSDGEETDFIKAGENSIAGTEEYFTDKSMSLFDAMFPKADQEFQLKFDF